MKKIMFLVAFLIAIPVSLAHFLSEYPDFVMDYGEVDAVIVVGDKAPATHVLAQTQIALSLSSLAEERPIGITKLDSEIDDIENKNIISIGSACINSVTRKILDNPIPCNKGIERGKATIRVYEGDNEEVYIVISAFSDKGILRAVEVLENRENYNLAGDLITIEVEEEIEEVEKEEIKEEEEETEESIEDNEEIIETKEEIEEETKTEINEVKEENFVKRILSFILSIFRK